MSTEAPNHTITLTLLEDLIHWPLPPRDGNIKNINHNNNLEIDEDENNNNNTVKEKFSAVGSEEKYFYEPIAVKKKRYHHVLFLYYLCQQNSKQNNKKWSEEVLFYLARSVEEQDGYLNFSVALSLLSLTRMKPEFLLFPNQNENNNKNNFSSYLSLEEVNSIMVLLASSKEKWTRSFISQIIIPLLFFGVPNKNNNFDWETFYVPTSLRSLLNNNNNNNNNHKHSEMEDVWTITHENNNNENNINFYFPVYENEKEPHTNVSAFLEENILFSSLDNYANIINNHNNHETLQCSVHLHHNHNSNLNQNQNNHNNNNTVLKDAPLGEMGISYHSFFLQNNNTSDYFSFNVQFNCFLEEVNDYYYSLCETEKNKNNLTLRITDYVFNSEKNNKNCFKLKKNLKNRMKQFFALLDLLCDHNNNMNNNKIYNENNINYANTSAVAFETISVFYHILSEFSFLLQKNNNNQNNNSILIIVDAPKNKLLKKREEVYYYMNAMMTRHTAVCVLLGLYGDSIFKENINNKNNLESLQGNLRTATQQALQLFSSLFVKYNFVSPNPTKTNTHNLLLQVSAGPPASCRIEQQSAWPISFNYNENEKNNNVEDLNLFGALNATLTENNNNNVQPLSLIHIYSRFRLQKQIKLSMIRNFHNLVCLDYFFNNNNDNKDPLTPRRIVKTRPSPSREEHTNENNNNIIFTLENIFLWLTYFIVPFEMLNEEEKTQNTKNKTNHHKSLSTASIPSGYMALLLSENNNNNENENNNNTTSWCPTVLTGESSASMDSELLDSILESFYDMNNKINEHLTALISNETPVKEEKLKKMGKIVFNFYQIMLVYVLLYSSWRSRWYLAVRLPSLTAVVGRLFIKLSIIQNKNNNQNENEDILNHNIGLLYYDQLVQFWECFTALSNNNNIPFFDDVEVEVQAVNTLGATYAVLTTTGIALAQQVPLLFENNNNNKKKKEINEMVLAFLFGEQSSLYFLRENIKTIADPNRKIENNNNNNKKMLRPPRVRCCGVSTLAFLLKSSTRINTLLQNNNNNNNNNFDVTNLMNLLLQFMEDTHSLVKIKLVSQLYEILLSDPQNNNNNNQTKLLKCLAALSQHELWRMREQYVWLLASMLTEFLKNNHPNQKLYQFARNELLLLFIDCLFDKASYVRDSALAAAVQVCEAIESENGQHHKHKNNAFEFSQKEDFVNDVLWPTIVRHAAQTHHYTDNYLNRMQLLKMAVQLNIHKTEFLIPLLENSARDSIVNVRMLVGKVIQQILKLEEHETNHHQENNNNNNNHNDARTKSYETVMERTDPLALTFSKHKSLLFTREERNGVIIELLRYLLNDSAADVREEAAKALELCF